MPYLFMPAKDPDEVIRFFDLIVQDGRLKVINAEERPDVWTRVEPCDDVRLIVGAAGTVPPEGTDIARVLSEFRPEPDAETQFASWTAETESDPKTDDSEPDSGSESTDDSAELIDPAQDPTPADALVPPSPDIVDDVPTDTGASAMDKPWTSFASRGFKG